MTTSEIWSLLEQGNIGQRKVYITNVDPASVFPLTRGRVNIGNVYLPLANVDPAPTVTMSQKGSHWPEEGVHHEMHASSWRNINTLKIQCMPFSAGYTVQCQVLGGQ